jgi:hypothetical protein
MPHRSVSRKPQWRWTDQELAAAVGRWLEGRTTATRAEYTRDAQKRADLPAITVLNRRVGGWYRVLEEAGWDNVGASIRGQRRWDPSSASAALRGWLEGRRSARADDYARDAFGSARLPSPSVLSRLFGGWTAAIRSAGWTGPTAAQQRARPQQGTSRRGAESLSRLPPTG